MWASSTTRNTHGPARYAPERLGAGSWDVPEVLLSGHHEAVARWRGEAALEKTRVNRPDLLRIGAPMTGADTTSGATEN